MFYRSIDSTSTRTSARLTILSIVLVAGLLTAPPAVADTAQDPWAEGVQAFRSGDLDTAATRIGEVVADKPDWYGGHLVLGQVYLKQERPADAVAALDRAHALAPGDATVRLVLGQAALATSDFAKVREVLDGPRPDGLDDARWQLWRRLRAEAAIGTGDPAEALAGLESLLAEKEDAELRWKAVGLAHQVEDRDAELRHLRAGERTDDVRFLARRLENGLAEALALDENAEATACRALAADARRLARSNDADHLVTAGRLLGCAGDETTAIATLEKAVEKAPAGSFDPAYHLGRQRALADELSAAEATLSPLAKRSDLEPDDERRVLDWLGYSIERQERFDEAIALYRRAGLDARVANAEKAREIHQANLEAEAIAKREKEILDAIREIEGEGTEGGRR